MISNATIVRFVESFIAVFVVALAADPVFSGTFDLFGEGSLKALTTAVVAAVLIAARRMLAVNQP